MSRTATHETVVTVGGVIADRVSMKVEDFPVPGTLVARRVVPLALGAPFRRGRGDRQQTELTAARIIFPIPVLEKSYDVSKFVNGVWNQEQRYLEGRAASPSLWEGRRRA